MLIGKVAFLENRARHAHWTTRSFLGAFEKLRKSTVSFVTAVCPLFRLEQLGFHWTDFHEI